jgi:hypothetical protein
MHDYKQLNLDALEIAQEFHYTYERLAPDFGYETRKESAVPWEDVPITNRALMVNTVKDLLKRTVILPRWMGRPPATFPRGTHWRFLPPWLHSSSWCWRIEPTKQDCWVGVFWKNTEWTYNIYVCVIPCFPIRINGPRKHATERP